MAPALAADDPILRPLFDVLAEGRLGAAPDSPVRVEIVAPAYPSFGVGRLRVVRVDRPAGGNGATSVIATYEDFRRPPRDRSAP